MKAEGRRYFCMMVGEQPPLRYYAQNAPGRGFDCYGLLTSTVEIANDMMRYFISVFLHLVGLLWAAVVSWLFVIFGGASDPAFLGRALLGYWWMFIGPILLLIGAVSALIGRRQVAGSVVSLIGCVVLSLTVGYETTAMLHDVADPLMARPPFRLYGLALFLTLLADAGAVHLYRLGRTRARVSC